jgi:activator of 2-hydroxyglutaryl-CoA dehydratase/predicted nucleotide-binding protein (sugar kinase/HSP70/actin superfamily)
MVLLADDGSVALTQYQLHRSDILTTFESLLSNTVWRIGDAYVDVCVTGSAGMRLAEILGAPFMQEVLVCRQALQELLPEVDVAIELGGEDAKILFMHDGVEQRMNGACAGGTGGFIDLMAGMLGVRASEFNSLAGGYQTIYPIASRCAVFAQTDVRPLINEGARRADIAASVLQAVVTQTVAGLACGRSIQGTVAFLGGPLQVYPNLVQAFRKTLGLSHAQTVKPADAHLFVARGAALLAGRLSAASSGAGGARVAVTTMSDMHARLAQAPREADGGLGRLPALFDGEAALEEFKRRHSRHAVGRARLMGHTGPVFLGIDAGSTTLKLAAIDEQGRLLYSSYERTRGDVVASARQALEDFYAAMPREYDGSPLAYVRHAKMTGYGEQICRCALAADSGEVETIAHLRAARAFAPDVDFLLDIGGQDIKCLRIRDGRIDDIMLNEACSSGCGALIEGFSRSLGFTKWSFSDIALSSRSPVDLGTRCTVFMTSRVRHAQKEGVPAADIAAGLAYSVVRNALYKVIGCVSPSQLGKRVVVCGGTFMSDAVLRTFELECGIEAIRPDIANLMGAYGAALLARDECLGEESPACGECLGEESPARGECLGEPPQAKGGLSSLGASQTESAEGGHRRHAASSLLGRFELGSLAQKQISRRCEGCSNACLLTVSAFTSEGARAGDGLYGLGGSGGLESLSGLGGSGGSGGLEGAVSQPYAHDALRTRVFVTGNRCERGATLAGASDGNPADASTGGPQTASAPASAGQPAGASPRRAEQQAPGTARPFNLFASEQALRARRPPLSRDAEPLGRVPRPMLGIPSTLGMYDAYPFWRECFTALGFDVLPQLASSAALYRKGAQSVLSESICFPAKLTHGHIAALSEQGAGYILLACGEERASIGVRCPVLGYYARTAAEDLTCVLGGAAGLIMLDFDKLERGMSLGGMVMESLANSGAIDAVQPSVDMAAIEAALAAAEASQQSWKSKLWDLADAALLTLEANNGTAMVLAGHPYHSDPGLLHGIDWLAGSLGYPVFSATSLERAAGVAGRAYPEALLGIAAFVAAHPRLVFVQLHSFGCGIDASVTDAIRKTIEDADKIYTVLKIDEMVDLASVRIRLRSLAAALAMRQPKPSYMTGGRVCSMPGGRVCSMPDGEASASGDAARIVLPALMPEYTEALARALSSCGLEVSMMPQMADSDIECGLLHASNDLCHHMLSMIGQAIAWAGGRQQEGAQAYGRQQEGAQAGARQQEGAQAGGRQQEGACPEANAVICLPQLCMGCRGMEAERILSRALRAAGIETGMRVIGMPSLDHPAILEPRWLDAMYDALAATDAAHDAAELAAPAGLPRVAVLGNAGMLFTGRLNRDVASIIESEGCVPVFPHITELLASNSPLERQIPALMERGIHDVIYVQSFGCLTGHVNARGLARRLKQENPGLEITFIDYDSGASAINQLNRLKLALAIARERALGAEYSMMQAEEQLMGAVIERR